jgi:hypothetical protein
LRIVSKTPNSIKLDMLANFAAAALRAEVPGLLSAAPGVLDDIAHSYL